MAAKEVRRDANRRAKRKRAIWTLDCETDPFEQGVIPKPFLWGLYDGGNDDYHEFDDADSLVEFIRDKEIVIYAHNGGKFDYHYLKPHFNSDESIMVIGQRIARFRIGEAELRDSTNLLPIALAEYQKGEIDYEIFRPGVRDIPANNRAIRIYLKSDCVNLYNIVRDFLTRYGSHLTQAGAAMKYWSKNYGTEAPRQSLTRFEQMRPFYYGGRVQCFAQGYAEKPFKVLDINSAYPFAMTHKHPYSVDCTGSRTLPSKESDLQTALIRLTAVAKGSLPLRADDGSLYFPDDEYRGREYCITGWEFIAGLETGTLKPVRIKEVLTFRETVCFADYVSEFYEQRKRAKACGDKAGDIFAKIFLNSLYGKFAANPAKYREYIVTHMDSVPKYQGDGYALNSQWDDERVLLTRPLPEGRRRYYNIATAASITGFVRAYLWRSLQQCSGVLYCDTDSIAAASVDSLKLGNGLGAWKEEMTCDRYAIAGKKLYAFRDATDPENWKVACKGVKLTADQIVRVAKSGRVEYTPEIPTYSIHRQEPTFVPRVIVSTYRDISRFPGQQTGGLGKGKKAA
ncbi:MAG: DNA polymerase [Hyphomonadaceae bacterium]